MCSTCAALISRRLEPSDLRIFTHWFVASTSGASSDACRTSPTITPMSSACGPRQLPSTSVRGDGVARGSATSPGSLISTRTTPGSRRSESSAGCRNVASQLPPGTVSYRKRPKTSVVVVRPIDGLSTRTMRTVAPVSGTRPTLS